MRILKPIQSNAHGRMHRFRILRLSQAFLFFLFASPLLSSTSQLDVDFVKNRVREFRNNNRIPGVAVAVYYSDKAYFFNAGYSHPLLGRKITEHTIFEIASITKSFTATLLALQVERGKMQLQDHMGKYLPFVRNHPSPLSQITLEELATHTSSLPREPALRRNRVNRRQIWHSLLGWRPPYPIGTHFLYSNLGYKLLGYALENIYRMPYQDIVEQEITAPLGMYNTFLHVPAPLIPQYSSGFNKFNRRVPRHRAGNYAAAGGLKSSSFDLMNFMKANMGIYGPPELIKAMELTHKGRFRANPHMVQGLSWQNFTKNGVSMIDKNGGLGGFSSWMGWIPKEQSPKNMNIGVIVLSNKRCKRTTPFGRQLLTQLAKR